MRSSWRAGLSAPGIVNKWRSICPTQSASSCTSCSRSAEGVSTFNRAAACSNASGKPSRRTQSSATLDEFSTARVNSGCIARARSVKSATAGTSANTSAGGRCRRSGVASGATGNSCCQRDRKLTRLVERIFNRRNSLSSASRTADPPDNCSQPSKMSRQGIRRRIAHHSTGEASRSWSFANASPIAE